ncbi:mechanosensitive ion channel [Candidatus Peregrinibacteria bacterium]|nr:MAG: mechanosensitive ion channel [Candidatus Peregrinibacteria bacterium]
MKHFFWRQALFFTIGWILFLPSASAFRLIDFTGGQQGTNTGTDTVSEQQSLTQSISQIQTLQQKLKSLEIDLRLETERPFPEKEEIETASQALANLRKELEDMENAEKRNEEDILKKREEVEIARFEFEQKQQSYRDKVEIHIQKTEQIKNDITETEAEIQKTKELAKNQAVELLARILFFLMFILILLILRRLSGKMISRLSGNIPIARERALLRINRIAFNVLIATSVGVGLFSQVLNFLPFVAILGTALAFALRDIIVSFIAWFLIGTEQGYKIGDLIQIGELRGRVMEVHPLLTVLRQTGMRGDTGRIMSFPNKFLFEQSIQNFSKMFRFIYIMADFLLERNSDATMARKELGIAAEEALAKDIEEARKNLPNLQSKFGIKQSNIMPQVFVEPDPRGILLRIKYFCRLDNRHISRTNIMENFLARIKDNPEINLRFVEFGEKKDT